MKSFNLRIYNMHVYNWSTVFTYMSNCICCAFLYIGRIIFIHIQKYLEVKKCIIISNIKYYLIQKSHTHTYTHTYTYIKSNHVLFLHSGTGIKQLDSAFASTSLLVCVLFIHRKLLCCENTIIHSLYCLAIKKLILFLFLN